MPDAIVDVLVARAEELFRGAPQPFTPKPQANALVSDLAQFPHAFVFGCIMDRGGIRAERVWEIPFRLRERLGSFSLDSLAALTRDDFVVAMTHPTPLHRYSSMMARFLHVAVERIAQTYAGDVSRIWQHTPSSASVVLDFLRFPGIGIKIATMAANILYRDFKIPLRDRFSLDVSPDVHVRRVFSRLFDCEQELPVDEVIYLARSLHPEYPGIFDLPLWEVGRTWCLASRPRCPSCSLRSVCRYRHKTNEA